MSIFILLLVASINIVLWFNSPDRIAEGLFFIPSISIFLSIAFVWPKMQSGKIEIRIIYFLLLGIIYFNAPLYLYSLLNPQDAIQIIYRLGITESGFIKSSILLGISLPMLIAGYLLNMRRRPIMELPEVSLGNFIEINVSIFLVIAYVFLILSINVTGLVVGSTYIGTSSYYYILLTRSILILVSILFFNKVISVVNLKPKNFIIPSKDVLSYLVIFLFIVYVLIGGDRGPALTVIFILIFGYLLKNNMRINIGTFVGGAVFILIMNWLLGYIEVLRTFDAIHIDRQIIENSLSVYKDYESTLGVSIRCTSLAIDGIENGIYPHTYGLFLLQSVLKGIPYFGSVIIDLFVDDTSILANGSAHLLTIQNSGVYYTSGIGTTYLADIYIEFGLVGIIFISFFYGVLTGRFEEKCKYNSFRGYSDFLLVLLFVGYAFYTGRSTPWSFLVNFIHTWILFALVYYLMVRPLFMKRK